MMTNQRRHSQLPEGQAQQEGPGQQGRAGDCCPCTVALVGPVALAPVGAVTVVGEAALHLGPRAAAVNLVAEILVCARLHHGVWKRELVNSHSCGSFSRVCVYSLGPVMVEQASAY